MKYPVKFELCTSCDYPTNHYTWIRQRIVCRRCWELLGAPHLHSEEQVFGEEE